VFTSDQRDARWSDIDLYLGLAWHHVGHARSCIERDKPWQAEYRTSGVRDQTLALACLPGAGTQAGAGLGPGLAVDGKV
jgi:hypothetical protein